MFAFLAVFIPSLAFGGLMAAAWHLSRAYQNQYAEDCQADDMDPVVRLPVLAPAARPKRRARKSGVRLEGSLKGYAAA